MEIRVATQDDYDAFARLMPELGVEDPVPSRERFGAELSRILIAAEGGAVVGYALIELLADTGYVRNLVSDPAHRRRGIGVALMENIRQRFLAAGATTWCLNVKPDNHAAIALYQRFGFAPAYRAHVLRMAASAPPIAIAANLALSPIAREEEAEVEATTGLLRGQLASARAKLGRILLSLRRDGRIAGVVVFSSEVPGAFPFRVVEPALGPALLQMLRALAPAGSPYVQVAIEDDDALRDALLLHGAYQTLEILHMRGPLDPASPP